MFKHDRQNFPGELPHLRRLLPPCSPTHCPQGGGARNTHAHYQQGIAWNPDGRLWQHIVRMPQVRSPHHSCRIPQLVLQATLLNGNNLTGCVTNDMHMDRILRCRFGGHRPTRVRPKNHVLDGVQIPREGALLRGYDPGTPDTMDSSSLGACRHL